MVRKLSWQVVVFCVACGKIAGFDDLQGADGSDPEAGAGGDAGAGESAGKGGLSASGGTAGASSGGSGGKGTVGGSAGSGASGGSSDGEGGSGDVPGAGATGGNAGAAASAGSAGAGGGTSGAGGVAGTSGAGGAAGANVTAGSSGTSAGSSGTMNGGAGGAAGTAGSAGAGGGGAGIGNPSGCGELLANGSFEQGRLGWDVMSSYPNLELNVHPAIAEREDDALVAEGVTPHAGDFLGWVGGVPDSNREYNVFVTQPIVISENVTDLLFTGFILIRSDEPTDVAYDDLYVEILDPEYERVWQFGAFSNQHQGPSWFSVDAIDPYPDDLDFLRGRELRFGVYSRTDPEVSTHFFFDSLSLLAVCD